jgi:hypothetical protein
MMSGDNPPQMLGPGSAGDPAARARAASARNAAIVRIRSVRTRAIVGAVGFSLLFAALAQALAPGRNVNGRAGAPSLGPGGAGPTGSADGLQGPSAPPGSAPSQAGQPSSAPPVIAGGS